MAEEKFKKLRSIKKNHSSFWVYQKTKRENGPTGICEFWKKLGNGTAKNAWASGERYLDQNSGAVDRRQNKDRGGED